MWNLWLTATDKWEEVEVMLDLAESARVDADAIGTVITFDDGECHRS